MSPKLPKVTDKPDYVIRKQGPRQASPGLGTWLGRLELWQWLGWLRRLIVHLFPPTALKK